VLVDNKLELQMKKTKFTDINPGPGPQDPIPVMLNYANSMLSMLNKTGTWSDPFIQFLLSLGGLQGVSKTVSKPDISSALTQLLSDSGPYSQTTFDAMFLLGGTVPASLISDVQNIINILSNPKSMKKAS
jgi:hypothetical protein